MSLYCVSEESTARPLHSFDRDVVATQHGATMTFLDGAWYIHQAVCAGDSMLLGKYEVLGQLGTGGFGRVLLARDTEAQDEAPRLVAIKRLRRARAQHRGIREAIEYEAEIGSYLRHPNIVHVIELTQVGGDLLLVMEFINGLGLDELLDQAARRKVPMEPSVALEVAIQAGKGLEYAHSATGSDGRTLAIVHRDVKPSNIMIGREGRVRIMDFGVALAAFRKFHTTTGTIKGTLRYLSPEQASGRRKVGPAADQFALSLVLGEMILGQPVYEADREHRILLRAMKGEIGDAPERAESILPGIGPVLARGLALHPGERFASVGRMVDALEEIRSQHRFPSIDLEEFVHLGLEERARLALEEASHFGQEATGQTSTSPQARGMTSEVLAPMGWANDQLGGTEEPPVDGGAGDGSWQLVMSQSTPLLPRAGIPDSPESLWDVIAASESKVIMCAEEEGAEDEEAWEDEPPVNEEENDWDFSRLDEDAEALAAMRLDEVPGETHPLDASPPPPLSKALWSGELPATSYAVKRARREVVGSVDAASSPPPSHPRSPLVPFVAEPVDAPGDSRKEK